MFWSNIVELISHLAWPAVAVFCVFQFKDGILALLDRIKKIKISGFEAETELVKRNTVEELTQRSQAKTSKDFIANISGDKQPLLKIIDNSWTKVEQQLDMLLTKLEKATKIPQDFISKVDLAYEHALISLNERNALKGLFTMRDLALNAPSSGERLTPENAKEFAVLASANSHILSIKL